MDVDTIQYQLARIAQELDEIKHLIREQVKQQTELRQRAAGQPANVAYIASKFPRHDGDKLVKAPEPKS